MSGLMVVHDQRYVLIKYVVRMVVRIVLSCEST